MKISTNTNCFMLRKTGWIIEGSNNIHLTFVKEFEWPVLSSSGEKQVGLLFKAWDGSSVTARVMLLNTEQDIYSEAMVGGKHANITPPTVDDLDVKIAAVLEPNGKIKSYAGDTMSELGDVLADAYFDEEETIQTLAQFKAQAGYIKISYFLQSKSETFEFIITN